VSLAERNYRVLTMSLAFFAGLVVVYTWLQPGPIPVSSTAIRDAAVFAVLALIADEMAVEVSDRVTLAAGNLPFLLAIMFAGRLPALGVAVAVGLWGAWRESSRSVVVYNAANFVAAVFLSSLAFDSVVRRLGIELDQVSVGLLAAGAVAAVTFEAANLALLSVGMRVKYGRKLRAFWRQEMLPFLRSLGVLLLLGLAIAALYAVAGIVSVALLFIPLLASQYMFKLLVREKQHLAKQKELSDKYLEMNIGLAAAMVVLLDSKDEYTAQHSAAVAMYCRDIAWPSICLRRKPRRYTLRACSTTLARWVFLTRSCARPQPSTRRSGASSSNTPKRAPRCCRTWRPTRTSPTSSATTTSGWTGVGTQAASPRMRSRSRARSLRSPIRTTR